MTYHCEHRPGLTLADFKKGQKMRTLEQTRAEKIGIINRAGLTPAPAAEWSDALIERSLVRAEKILTLKTEHADDVADTLEQQVTEESTGNRRALTWRDILKKGEEK